MTIVNHDTGEITDVSYSDVKRSVAVARESGTSFFEQIVWQIENQAWLVLGYADWDEMREAEYGDMGVVVPRADRPEVVSRLRRAGMTQQDIADTVGVSVGTVNKDLIFSSENEDAEPVTNTRGQDRPASYAKRPTHPVADDEAHSEPTIPAPADDSSASGSAQRSAPPIDPAEQARREAEDAERQLDQGRRDTCTRIAECVRFLDGGDEYAAIFLDGFYPHEHRFLAEPMRLTVERLDSAIDFLTSVRKGIQ